MFAKIEVNGDGACELYNVLKAEQPGEIAWNFTKFLIDGQGRVVARFGPKETPEEIAVRLDELL
ncbi:MAG: glutathione peroxidase [Gammaproteobacteria bacterium]|nr:glutathione peroxidase [Gammaproteobacteria bacterium]